MRADGESGAVEVGNQTLFLVHGLEWRRGVGLWLVFEQRAGAADGTFDLPESVAAMKRKFRVSSFRFRVARNFTF
jgi:hypothetical protein